MSLSQEWMTPSFTCFILPTTTWTYLGALWGRVFNSLSQQCFVENFKHSQIKNRLTVAASWVLFYFGSDKNLPECYLNTCFTARGKTQGDLMFYPKELMWSMHTLVKFDVWPLHHFEYIQSFLVFLSNPGLHENITDFQCGLRLLIHKTQCTD